MRRLPSETYEEFLMRRKQRRAEIEVSPVWERSPSPPSPRESKTKDEFGRNVRESKTNEAERETKHKQISSSDSSSSSSNSSSESESSTSASDARSKKRKHKSRSHHVGNKTKKRTKSKKRSASSSLSPASESEVEDNVVELWAEKAGVPQESSSIGPVPLPQVQAGSYGAALLPGEGDAIAQFVLQNKRIPRRGEIGLTSDEIAKFEDQGFVMSGSRHKRMTAVRIRKENQVYSAEEKRALAMANFEEKAIRENKILADFREMLQSKLGK